MKRRAFFGWLGGAAAIGAAAAATGCTGGDASGTNGTGGNGATGVVNQFWEDRADQLEAGNGVYTAADPRDWAGKEGTHVPAVAFNADGTVTVSCTHGMAEDHWISTLYVRDQDGYVIHLVEILPRGTGALTAASVTFRPRAGTTAITAYAYCNKHDVWADVQRAMA
jgi:desulfoferrodoxin (superoxide reductase-like protein)